MQVQALTARLAARVEQYRRDDATEVLLGEEGSAEADRLWELIAGDLAEHPDAVDALTAFHWTRLAVRWLDLGADPPLSEVDGALAAADDVEHRVAPAGEHLAELCSIRAGLWRERFTHTRSAEALDRASEAAHLAVAATADPQYRGSRLLSLAETLLARHEWRRSREDLDAVLTWTRAAADHPGLDEQQRPRALATAAQAARARFTFTGDVADLRAAVARQQRAVDLTPSTSADHALRAAVLMEAQHLLTEVEPEPGGAVRPTPTAAATVRSTLLLRTVAGPGGAWHWELSAGAGVLATAAGSSLDSGGWQDTFLDLSGYLSRYSVPDLDPDYLRDLLDPLGRQVTRELLGDDLAARIAAELPATITVRLDDGRDRLLGAPLEIAVVDGRTLAERGATFVYSVAGESGPTPGAPLRMLAVFPLPGDAAPLGLRAERRAIEGVVAQVRAAGRAIEFACLQYGVTRQSLGATLTAGRWDIVHIGGHGGFAGLTVEDETGGTDDLSTGDLLELLTPQVGRAALVMLGCCGSGANSAARILGPIFGTGDSWWRSGAQDTPGEPATAARAYGLAVEVARHLGTTVVAMRFAVDDTFARDYATALYEGLLLHGLTVGEASERALARIASSGDADAFGVLGPLTPIVYVSGDAAARPVARAVTHPALTAVSELPAGSLFVGRTALLAKLSGLVGPAGSAAAVQLAGSPGAGKTVCIDEFAATAGPGFDRVVRPDLGEQPDPRPLLDALDGGLLRSERTLVILDPLDAALDADGRLTPRWQATVEALTGRGGRAKVILAARHPIPGLPAACVPIVVEPLSGSEGIALAATLPNLGHIARAARRVVPPQGMPLYLAVAHAWGLAGGHPGLLVALDSLGDSLLRLRTAVQDASQLALLGVDPGPDTRWQSVLRAGQWARDVLARLTPAQHLALRLLAVVPVLYRTPAVVEQCWPAWWREHGGASPEPPFAELAASLPVTPEPDLSLRIDPLIEVQLAGGEEHPDAVTAVHETIADTMVQLWWLAAYAPPDGKPAPADLVTKLALWAVTALDKANRHEHALWLLYTLPLLSSSTPAIARTVAGMATGIASRMSDRRLQTLAGLVTGAALVRSGHADGVYHVLVAFGLAKDEYPDVAAVAGVHALGLLLDDGDLDAYGTLLAQLATLDPQAGHVDIRPQLRYEQLRHQLLRNEPEAALAGAEALLRQVGAGDGPAAPPSAADPLAVVRVWGTAGVIDDATVIAIIACGQLGRWDDQLRLAKKLAVHRAKLGSTAGNWVQALAYRMQALMNLGRFEDARRVLDGYQREVTRQRDNDSLVLAATIRGWLDILDGRHRNIDGLHRQVLATRYRSGAGPMELGVGHLNVLGGVYGRMAGEPDEDEDEDDAERLFDLLPAHLLGSLFHLCLAGQTATAARTLDMHQWLLSDHYDEGGTVDALGIEWVDRALNAATDQPLPFARTMRRLAGDRLPAVEQQVRDLLTEARRDSDQESQEHDAQMEQARAELAPMREAVLAAVQGDRDSLAAVHEVCDTWERDEQTRPLALAFRALLEGRDPVVLLDIVGLQGAAILAPLVRDLTIIGHLPG